LGEWKEYYYGKVRSKEHIDKLGKTLFDKIRSVIKEEVETITEEDCLNYMHELVTKRTFDGYVTEISIIKEILEKELDINIQEAPDEWDRLFAVDFFIKFKDKYLGLQIKPQDIGFTSQIFAKERGLLISQHKKFTDKYKGKVFVVYSIKEGNKKVVQNKEVVDEIKQEMRRLTCIIQEKGSFLIQVGGIY